MSKNVNQYIKPKILFPLIKFSMYRKQYDLCEVFCKDNKENSTEHYIVKPVLNKSKTFNYAFYEKNKENSFLEFNEFAAVPSQMMNYESHIKWNKAIQEITKMIEDFPDKFADKYEEIMPSILPIIK